MKKWVQAWTICIDGFTQTEVLWYLLVHRLSRQLDPDWRQKNTKIETRRNKTSKKKVSHTATSRTRKHARMYVHTFTPTHTRSRKHDDNIHSLSTIRYPSSHHSAVQTSTSPLSSEAATPPPAESKLYSLAISVSLMIMDAEDVVNPRGC